MDIKSRSIREHNCERCVCVAVVCKCVCVYLLSQQWRRDEKRLPHYTLNAAALFFSLSFLQAVRESANKFQHFFCARSQPSKRITDNYPARQNSNTRNDIICCMRRGRRRAHTRRPRQKRPANRERVKGMATKSRERLEIRKKN